MDIWTSFVRRNLTLLLLNDSFDSISANQTESAWFLHRNNLCPPENGSQNLEHAHSSPTSINERRDSSREPPFVKCTQTPIRDTTPESEKPSEKRDYPFPYPSPAQVVLWSDKIVSSTPSDTSSRRLGNHNERIISTLLSPSASFFVCFLFVSLFCFVSIYLFIFNDNFGFVFIYLCICLSFCV